MTAGSGTLQAVVAHWLPRMQTAGLTAGDLDRVIGAAGDWANWCRSFSEEAARHAAEGEAAEALGRTVSAGEAYLRAALWYHFGQFVFFDDLDQKQRAADAKVRIFRRAAPLFTIPAEQLGISFRDGELRAYLRRPSSSPAPLAILIPGSDSTKEEFPRLERHFLDRGMATLSVDGPGQGEGRQFGPLTPDWDAVLRALHDAVRPTTAVDVDRVGVVGMAFGGHLALQGAPGFAGLKAVVSLNGFFDLGSFWTGLPEVYRRNMRFALGGTDDGDTRDRAARFTLVGQAAPPCPTLIIHGGRDRIFPVAEAEKFASYGDRAEIVIFEEGNHVCNNIAYRARSLAADWLAEKLA